MLLNHSELQDFSQGMLGQGVFFFSGRFESGRIPGTAGNHIMLKNGINIKEREPQSRGHETDLFDKYTFNKY
jgi:hypothetical protein